MRIAKALGATFALFHAIIVILLQFGILDYWQRMHMVTFQYNLEPFNVLTFIIGTVMAGIVGFIVGLIYEKIYSKVR